MLSLLLETILFEPTTMSKSGRSGNKCLSTDTDLETDNASPFHIPNFEEVTTDRAANYCFLVMQDYMDIVRDRCKSSTAVVDQHYKEAHRQWHENPENPSNWPPYPITLAKVNDFYAKCDRICNSHVSSIVDYVSFYFEASKACHVSDSCRAQHDSHSLCCQQWRPIYPQRLYKQAAVHENCSQRESSPSFFKFTFLL